MWRYPYNSDEILRTIEHLSRSYVPEWRLDIHTPDIGSVIAMIFAGQMEYASRECSQIPHRCIEELVRMLGIACNLPVPAAAVLVMEVDEACKEGIRIPKGSGFYADAAELDMPVVFRTQHDLLAVHAELSCVLGISEAEKKIVSYKEKNEDTSIPMFDFSGENLYREEIVVKDSLLSGGSLFLKRPFEEKELFLEDVRIKAWGRNISPTFLYDGEQELPRECAAIFGREIFPYKECYIGQDEVLSKSGARIVCTFELEWGRFDSGWRKERKKELKPIMKRAGQPEEEGGPHVVPQEISLAYFNGTGFKRLHCEDGTGMLTKVFSGRKQCRLCFSCPEDILPMMLGGYDIRCIRLQVKRADCCYQPGAVFYYPILKKVKFAYTYGKKGISPEAVLVHQGSSARELTEQLVKSRECRLFSEFPYEGESILFGFDRVWGAGPVSFYLELENHTRNDASEIAYEYSTADGFKTLHIIDGTQGLLKSGIVRFTLPQDAGIVSIEGRSCFWIRMREVEGRFLRGDFSKQSGLILKGLKLNGVQAENRYVSEEREFQIEKAEPELTVRLFGNHILDAAVWVNEISTLSDLEKEALLQEQPQSVKIEYDIRGQALGFYVKWKESPDLGKQGGDGRYYMLDRKAGQIRFGDGRHTKIPKETKGTAWKVKVISCDGSRGNVTERTITDPARPYIFLDKVYNPSGAYGGSDGGSGDGLVKRGRNFLSTGDRIVSESDFLREAEGFSDQISEAVLRKGKQAEYRLIVLLKEPKSGGFAQLKENLRVYLEEKFPLAFLGHTVQIREPVFVKISVNIWISAQAGEAYEFEELLLKKMDAYLNGRSLKIGDMPGRRELEQVLYQASDRVEIRYFQAVLTYTDDTGPHEAALEDIGRMQEAVYINGRHRVHYMASEKGEGADGRFE